MWHDSVIGSTLLLKPAAVTPEPPPFVIELTQLTADKLSSLTSGTWPAGKE